MNSSVQAIASGVLALLAQHSEPLRAQSLWAEISGTVRGVDGAPISRAVVRVQATESSTQTRSDGTFVLNVPADWKGALSAWAPGYYIGGIQWTGGDEESVIELRPLPDGDNPSYQWASPHPARWWTTIVPAMQRVFSQKGDVGSRDEECGGCHAAAIYPQWLEDAHSRSARNPVFSAFYGGADVDGTRPHGPGFRLDFPDNVGDCAACHAPRQALANPFGTDMDAVDAYDMSCDFCHKVRAVTLHPEGGYPGILSIALNRPAAGQQVIYGPFDDVIRGHDTYSPLHRSSSFCAPCHSGRFWGVPIYSEFDEWQASDYANEGIACQNCHMPPDGSTARIAPQRHGGVARNPQRIASHRQRGVTDVGFMKTAVEVTLTTSWVEDGRMLDTTVSVRNVGAGHHFPSGVPMRHAILVVDAFDADGVRLVQTGGPTVPLWCGTGDVAVGNLGGLPGKAYVKLLEDVQRAYRSGEARQEVPAPHWRQVSIVADTRLPAKQEDRITIRFAAPPPQALPVRLRVRMIYRRSFKTWIDAKRLPLQDLVLVDEQRRVD